MGTCVAFGDPLSAVTYDGVCLSTCFEMAEVATVCACDDVLSVGVTRVYLLVDMSKAAEGGTACLMLDCLCHRVA